MTIIGCGRAAERHVERPLASRARLREVKIKKIRLRDGS